MVDCCGVRLGVRSAEMYRRETFVNFQYCTYSGAQLFDQKYNLSYNIPTGIYNMSLIKLNARKVVCIGRNYAYALISSHIRDIYSWTD